jgi:LacI family transcriptional regulator
LGLTAQVLSQITSDTPPLQVEAAARSLMASPGAPDGIIVGSASGSMAIVAGAESLGLMLGRDFDVGTKDSVGFLRRFRSEMLVVREDVRKAGEFLARAVISAIDRRPPGGPCQYLDVPETAV